MVPVLVNAIVTTRPAIRTLSMLPRDTGEAGAMKTGTPTRVRTATCAPPAGTSPLGSSSIMMR